MAWTATGIVGYPSIIAAPGDTFGQGVFIFDGFLSTTESGMFPSRTQFSSGSCEQTRAGWTRSLRHCFLVIGSLFMSGSPLTAQPTATSGLLMTPDQTRQSVQWLADQLMQHVPSRIDGDDGWNDTKKVWAGVKVHREGWELRTNRRWRELRHGRWVRYTIELPPQTPPQPSESTDVVKIHSVTAVSSDDGLQSWLANTTVSTPARFSIRVERWNLGAKWYSIEINGKMNLAMHAALTMGMSADFTDVPPAMQLDVTVQEASLVVSGFEVESISKLGGDAAEEIGDLAEHTIGKVWLRKENARLVTRLNEAITENQDSLRWSMADWFVQLAP